MITGSYCAGRVQDPDNFPCLLFQEWRTRELAAYVFNGNSLLFYLKVFSFKLGIHVLNRGAYMSAYVLLNLLNELEKR